jgi:hypothetical protein
MQTGSYASFFLNVSTNNPNLLLPQFDHKNNKPSESQHSIGPCHQKLQHLVVDVQIDIVLGCKIYSRPHGKLPGQTVALKIHLPFPAPLAASITAKQDIQHITECRSISTSVSVQYVRTGTSCYCLSCI